MVLYRYYPQQQDCGAFCHPEELLCCERELVSCVGRPRDSLVGCQRLPELRDFVQALQRAVHVAGVAQIPQACATAAFQQYGLLWYL